MAAEWVFTGPPQCRWYYSKQTRAFSGMDLADLAEIPIALPSATEISFKYVVQHSSRTLFQWQ